MTDDFYLKMLQRYSRQLGAHPWHRAFKLGRLRVAFTWSRKNLPSTE